MLHEHVVKRPLILTEKGNNLREKDNKYLFEVSREANKHQIKDAIERQYNVKVVDVRTMNRKGKPRRAKFKMTTTSAWKKAIVELDENSRIELF